MRYTKAKDRLSRREGFDIFGKGAKLKRLAIPPGMHGRKGFTKKSAYGMQLREKQKAKRIYGVSEKQFKKYVAAAEKITGASFLELLERRLDNVVFRLGFAPTRASARQIVSHRHVLVDGKLVNIPSYIVEKGQTVSLDTTGQQIPEVKKLLEKEEISLPAWLERQAVVGRVARLPLAEDVIEPISEQDIVEFYSR